MASPLAGRASTRAGALPLFHAAWLFALGVGAAHLVWLRTGYLLVALSLLILMSCVAGFKALRIAWAPLALLWCLLGAWSAEMQPQPAPSQGILTLADNLLRTVKGEVVATGPVDTREVAETGVGADEGPTQRIDLRVASIEQVTDEVDEQKPIAGTIRVTVRWPQGSRDIHAFQCGEQIRLDARLHPAPVYRDPDVWSRRDYLLDQDITASSSVLADQVIVMGAVKYPTWPCRIAALQHSLSMRVMSLSASMQGLPRPLRLSPDDAVMLAAMTTGDRTFLSRNLRLGFERTGSFHMLVVSGLHLAIVAGFAVWILRLLGIPEVPTTLITMGVSIGYAILTGFGIPVQRSLWMVLIYLAGRVLYREANMLNSLGFAALGLLVASPNSLFNTGLQMTLLAVVAIAGVAIPLLQRTVHPYVIAAGQLRLVALDVKLPPRLAQFRVTLRMIATRLEWAISPTAAWRTFPWAVQILLRIVEAAVVSFVVELVMTMPMAVDFHRVTIFALPVNLLILPLLTLLVPVALLTLGVLLVWPAGAVLPAGVAAFCLHVSVGFVDLFGSFSLGDFRVPTPLRWQILMFTLLIAATVGLALQANRTEIRWLRPAAWIALLLAAGSTLLPRPLEHPRDSLLVEAIDVGQGDSILLITPDGKTLLVDGGGIGGGLSSSAPNFDVGEEVVSPVLWSRGIRHLDVVALTHAHSDHMGGLPAILRNFHPDTLWVGINPPVSDYNALLSEAASLKIPVHAMHAGDRTVLGEVQVHVLAPRMDYAPGDEPGNNDSMVLHVAFGATSVLLEGDAEAPVEQEMLNEPGLQSTLLKVGHHGSTSSTTPAFLARVAPKWAVISCGLNNRYGHPREEVLAALQAAHVRTYSTDINGATCFDLNGRDVTAEPLCGTE
jgi:competence protein ComEC